jgi:UDP-3-O-[3-hydroxymyristoyl] glucosamine N-acyltransferase
MKLAQPTTAAALARQLNARLIGDGEIEVTGLNEIHHVVPGDLCFVDHPKYYAKTLASAASVILIDREQACPEGKALLLHPEPFVAYNGLVWRARPQVPYLPVNEEAAVGEGTVIGPGVRLGKGVRIGQDCLLQPNCTIGDGCILGDRVTVSAGAVIGGEAFYFKRTAEGYASLRSGGSVHLQDDVLVGPCCTIARGVSTTTVIGRGSKLDAQVQIGHDCRIGAHVLMAAQVGVAGNCVIGDWCILQGQVGIAQNITIGERVTVLAQSGIGNDLEAGKTYFGSPAQESRKAFRELVKLRRL